MNITRKRRGYYRCDITLMFDHTNDLPENAVTEKYMRLLEDNINNCPELLLWTHNRWKRTWEGYQNWLAKHKTAAERISRQAE
jgi:KDO2-lipid IV(A) lauroyltransferase